MLYETYTCRKTRWRKWGKDSKIKKEIEDRKRKKYGQSGCITHRIVGNTDGFVLLSIW